MQKKNVKLLEDILSDNADLIHAGEGIAEDGGSGRGGGSLRQNKRRHYYKMKNFKSLKML